MIHDKNFEYYFFAPIIFTKVLIKIKDCDLDVELRKIICADTNYFLSVRLKFLTCAGSFIHRIKDTEQTLYFFFAPQNLHRRQKIQNCCSPVLLADAGRNFDFIKKSFIRVTDTY